jgi:hypothetical protein
MLEINGISWIFGLTVVDITVIVEGDELFWDMRRKHLCNGIRVVVPFNVID